MALARKTNDGGVVIHVATNDALARGTSLPQAANDNDSAIAELVTMQNEINMLMGRMRARAMELGVEITQLPTNDNEMDMT